MYSRPKARGMDGIIHIAGKKKLPYLSDKHFFEHMGFILQDEATPYFQLMALTWNDLASSPAFMNQVKRGLRYTIQLSVRLQWAY